MRQIIQDLQSGETKLEQIPAPVVKAGHVLIRTRSSLVSIGTERMLVEFGKANLISKARQQPERVKQVLDKIKSDGLWPTLEVVFKKLGEPLPLGYCNCGDVIAVGEGVTNLQVGDRVVSNGPHAEIVLVPKNLVAKLPEIVSYEEGSFAVIGAIGLQGIRLINPTFGETIVVVGLGLIGLITCQLLKANGCNVIGYDFDEAKVAMASSFGIRAFKAGENTDPVRNCLEATEGVGVDGVVITASTQSDEVISQAAQMSRKRGRIVLIGVIGLDIKRSDFYEKELSFQVSCSYGPGRYDDQYEQKGVDYPLPYVRWTERRNFEAVLSAIQSGALQVKPLITQVVEFENYNQIYRNIGDSRQIASVMRYATDDSAAETKVLVNSPVFAKGKPVFGIIGAGNFTKAMIVPLMRKLDYNLKYIASEKGLSSTLVAKKYNIAMATTDYREIIQDTEVNAVAITVRHNLHAKLVIEALRAGKHVFVEKPLALTIEELDQIQKAQSESGKSITVGFNRRFSPFAEKARQLIGPSGAVTVVATMNAGAIPPSSWVQDLKIGGGRIIGEACHYVDLITFFAGSLVSEVNMAALGSNPDEGTDNATLTLKYQNGSIGVINYCATGHKSYPKERIEVHTGGKSLVIDNFRKLQCFGYSTGGFSKTQDKGHMNQFRKLQEMLSGLSGEVVPFQETLNTSRAVILALESLRSGQWVKV